jgi:uncharacterized protein (DUF305 family)
MNSKTIVAVGLAGSLFATTVVVAQTGGQKGHDAHAGHAAPAAPADIANLPSVKAYTAANDRMHKDMSIAFTGNADVDFVKGMIPHHQGAIDMAKVVLEHGKDPQIRRLAREIIKAQNSEIAMMRAWLKKNEARLMKKK